MCVGLKPSDILSKIIKCSNTNTNMNLSTNEINTEEVTSSCRYLRTGSVDSYSQASLDPHTATVKV